MPTPTGDPHAGRLLGELRDQLSQRDHPAVGFVVSAIEVMLAIRAGRLDDAESLASICAKQRRRGRRHRHRVVAGRPAGDDPLVPGPAGGAAAHAARAGHSPALSAVDNSAVAALAVAAALAGDRRTAASWLARAARPRPGQPAAVSSWLVTMNGVVEAAYLLGDAEVAARPTTCCARTPACRWSAVSASPASARPSRPSVSPRSRRDSLDAAVDHLRAAVQHNLALAHWPALVSARQRLAAAHRLRGRPRTTARPPSGSWTPPGARRPPSASASASRTSQPPAGAPERRSLPATARAASGGSACGPSVLVEDSIGMLHLAVLIANPRQEIPAADLVAGLAVLGGRAPAARRPARPGPRRRSRRTGTG